MRCVGWAGSLARWTGSAMRGAKKGSQRFWYRLPFHASAYAAYRTIHARPAILEAFAAPRGSAGIRSSRLHPLLRQSRWFLRAAGLGSGRGRRIQRMAAWVEKRRSVPFQFPGLGVAVPGSGISGEVDPGTVRLGDGAGYARLVAYALGDRDPRPIQRVAGHGRPRPVGFRRAGSARRTISSAIRSRPM